MDAIVDHFVQPESVVYKSIHNHGKNICGRFHILAQFSFIVSDTELDYYHQKINLKVTSRAAEQFKFRILGNYEISMKSLKCFKLIGKYSAGHTKRKFWQLSQKAAGKHFIKTLYYLISWICLQYFVQGCNMYFLGYVIKIMTSRSAMLLVVSDLHSEAKGSRFESGC